MAQIDTPPSTSNETPGVEPNKGLDEAARALKDKVGTEASELGAGTTFKVYFPRSDLQPQMSAAPPSPITFDGTETILVVEDDASVRGTVRTILLKRGYNVLEAASGEEGLLMCEQYRASIDLLLTDVVMPRMTGQKLAEQVSWLRPELKVLYMSGYTEDTIVHHGVLDPSIAYLPKPITPASLARKVREVIDSPRSPTPASDAAG
jgi:CheY-like chemotaxis protein